MKTLKILSLSIVGIIISIMTTYAANMCIRDDANMVVLDPTIGGTVNGYNETGKTWSTKFSYGIISGIVACHSETGGDHGRVATNQNMSVYSTGDYCYCKMLRPVQSRWVYSGFKAGNPGHCVVSCAYNCASNVASAVFLRRGLFGSVGRN